MILVILFAILAIVGIVATLVTLASDGYRAVPTLSRERSSNTRR